MANIGEIEFLVRFDSMNTSFKKVLGEALENVSMGGDTSQKLEEIRTHLKALVVPYSGSRALDEIRAGGHIKQLADPDFLEKRVAAIAGKKTALGHMGFGELAPGSKEAETAVRKKLSDMHAMMIAQTNVAMKSEASFKQFYPTLRKMEGYMDLAAEGGLPYLMKNFMNLMIKEVPMVERYLELMKKEHGGDFDYAEGEAWWDKLTEDIGGGEGKISTQRDFYKAMIEHLGSKEDFKKIFFGGVNALTPELKTSWEDFLNENVLEKGKILLPRSLGKIAKDVEGKDVFDPSTYVRKDMRVLLSDPKLANEILTDLTELTEPAIEKILEDIREQGYALFTGEAAVVASIGKYQKDVTSRLPENMQLEELLIAYGGKKYSAITQRLSPYTEKEYEKMFEKEHMERIIGKVVELVKELGTSMEFLKGQSVQLPANVAKILEGNNTQHSTGDY